MCFKLTNTCRTLAYPLSKSTPQRLSIGFMSALIAGRSKNENFFLIKRFLSQVMYEAMCCHAEKSSLDQQFNHQTRSKRLLVVLYIWYTSHEILKNIKE